MARRTRHPARYLSPLLLVLPGCGPAPNDVAASFADALVIPAESEVIGTPKLQAEPLFKAAKWCPSGVQCASADIDDDERNDIVRIDRSGAIGTPGGVWVALGDGWGFGKPRLMGWCKPADHCTLGDVDGDGQLELVGFRPYAGESYYMRLQDDAKGPQIEFGKGVCWEGSRCQVADLNGDGLSDLIELSQDGGVRTFENLGKYGFDKPRVIEKALCSDVACRLGDVDGDGVPDLVRMPKPEQGAIDFVRLDQKRFGELTPWLEADCDKGLCDLADVLGTGTVQLLSIKDKHLKVVGARLQGKPFKLTLKLPVACGSDERCWWSDATADGRADFWRQTSDGTLLIYPVRDLLGTLQASMLDYTQLNQRWGQGVAREAEQRLFSSIHAAIGVPDDWDARFGPERFSWPSSVTRISDADYDAEATRLSNRAANDIARLLARLPPESALTDGIEQRRWQRALGHIISARTGLFATPVGTTRRAGADRCGNVVVHDQYILDDGEHVTPSYIARYFDALREPDQARRVSLAASALTAVWEGFRCLSQDELNNLEAAFVEAVATTLLDLQDSGHPLLARRMWDRSLPLTILFFDAVQHYTVPETWRLLQMHFDGGVPLMPPLPPRGFDFAAAAADGSCETLWCELYRSPARSLPENRVLTLDEIGVWLPELGENRLERFDVLADRLLPGMIDLRHFGEGDCMLGDVLRFGMRCPSHSTCDAPSAALATYPGMSSDPAPGILGSDLTHLMTDRSTLPGQNGCDGGSSGSPGGAPIIGCGGPPMRTRAGAFSPDPVIDRIFRCSLGATHVDMDYELDPNCLLVQDGPEDGSGGSGGSGGDGGSGGTSGSGAGGSAGSGSTAPDATSDLQSTVTQNELYRMFVSGGSIGGRSARDIAQAIVDGIRSRGVGRVPSVDEVLTMMRTQAGQYFGPGATRLRSAPDATFGGEAHVGGVDENNDILYNPNLMQETAEGFVSTNGGDIHGFVTTFLIHEYIHVTVNSLAQTGAIDGSWANNWQEVHPRITQPAIGHSCGIDQDCSSGCGLGDAIARRFASCVEGDPGTFSEDVRCRLAQDYCDGRGHGDMAGYVTGAGCTGSPSVTINSECFAVNCADSGSVTSACCGAISGGLPPSVFFIPRIDPGPRPPRPGLLLDGLPWADRTPLP